MNILIKLATLGATLALSACDTTTNKAVTEGRLDALVSNGIDPDVATKNDERLQAVLNRDNSIGALEGEFADFQSDPSAVYDIQQLVTLALERNPDIRRAVEELNLSEVQRLNAIFGYLPQVSGSFGRDQVNQSVIESDNAVFQEGDATFPVTTFALSLNQPIFDLSKIFDIQLASTARSKAEVEYVQAVRAVAFEIFDTALLVEQTQDRIESQTRRQSLLSRQISRNQALEAEGLNIGGQSSALQSDRATVLSDIATEQAERAAALTELSRMTGVLVQNVSAFQPSGSIAGTERDLVVGRAVALGLENNPDVMVSALEIVESEFLRRGALARDFSPVINLFAILEQEDREASRFGGGSVTEDTTIGVNVTVPIFNAGGNGYEFLTRNVEERAAVLDYHSTRRALEADIRSTHARMVQLTAAIAQARSAVSSAASAANTEARRVEAGESIDLALAGRQIRLTSAQERLAFQQFEYYRAWARLKFLTGADLAAGTL